MSNPDQVRLAFAGEVEICVHAPEVPEVLLLRTESAEHCARSLEDAGI